ncbi:low temperature requirement protein A [Burkholderia cenocepacia]|uniref:low temperature requirement protein A n=1 Tax=Burkholderia cenocepacia TaxID=95486 RepID=UPI0018A7EB88|nr:low temperature requirement protein A [Burkholderia cenocepacia]
MDLSQQKFAWAQPINARFGKVTSGALLIDLACVLTLMQLGYLLFLDFTWYRLALTSILWLSTWREWRYAGWAAWKFEHTHEPVYRVYRAAILLGLIFALGSLAAFGGDSLYFAITYSLAQAVRASVFIRLAGEGASSLHVRGYSLRCVAVSPILWFLGGVSDDGFRIVWWGAASLFDLTPMLAQWRLWAYRELSGSDWCSVHGQFVKRYRTVIAVALMVAASSTESAFSYIAALTIQHIIEFSCGVVEIISMCCLYLCMSNRDSVGCISQAPNTDRAITKFYLIHGLIVAGTVITASCNWLMLDPSTRGSSSILGVLPVLGPLVYVVGSGWYAWMVYYRRPTFHLIAITLFAAAGLCGYFFPIFIVLVAAITLLGVAWTEVKPAKARNTMGIYIRHASQLYIDLHDLETAAVSHHSKQRNEHDTR